MKKHGIVFIFVALMVPAAWADVNECSSMEVWDSAMSMCMPLPMAGMPMKMLMIRGNSFFTLTSEQGPRGRNAFSVPNVMMADVGSTAGDHHYLNLDFMGTLEKWTYPQNGYPELLQIGEGKANGQPYLDAQHPHSSPLMGLTLSDTIAFGSDKDHLKLWFAPRGESTDGPVPFMHRPTGMVNPDAPLGHHVGQDVGHVSSTVFGSSIQLANTTIEVSTFNGSEPSPTQVNLPLGSPNSYAARLTQQFSPHFSAMTSAAFVKSPELNDTDIDHVWRFSTSLYGDMNLSWGWMFHDALIWGLTRDYDEASVLNSFAQEFLVQKESHNIWGRIEFLQRTPAELEVAGTNNVNQGRWVTAVTVGYTHQLLNWSGTDFGLGGSFTQNFLPAEFLNTYGGNPVSVKLFVQLSISEMWNLRK